MTQKSTDQNRDVFLALAQGRHGNAHHIQAKEKVIAKFSLAHELRKILVCGRDEPHFRAQGLIAPYALESAFFAYYAQ